MAHALVLAVTSRRSRGCNGARRGGAVRGTEYLGESDGLSQQFGEEVAALATAWRSSTSCAWRPRGTPSEQNEILRKMVLGMAEDVRVVLIRLASRTQTLRFFSKNPSQENVSYARGTLDIYAPLANRLGVWQLKWELEDLSFRFLEPELYKRIAGMLDEKRLEREQYIAGAMKTLAQEHRGGRQGADHRPAKHIYSIWNKMRAEPGFQRGVRRARLRVIVPK